MVAEVQRYFFYYKDNLYSILVEITIQSKHKIKEYLNSIFKGFSEKSEFKSKERALENKALTRSVSLIRDITVVSISKESKQKSKVDLSYIAKSLLEDQKINLRDNKSIKLILRK